MGKRECRGKRDDPAHPGPGPGLAGELVALRPVATGARLIDVNSVRAGTKLVIMGSGVLIGSLMAANLIDEYLLMIHPLVLGAGRRMFPEGVQVPLRLADGVIASTGVVIASYERTTD